MASGRIERSIMDVAEIKGEIKRQWRSHRWLIDQLSKAGITLDEGALSNALAGRRSLPYKTADTIAIILGLNRAEVIEAFRRKV